MTYAAAWLPRKRLRSGEPQMKVCKAAGPLGIGRLALRAGWSGRVLPLRMAMRYGAVGSGGAGTGWRGSGTQRLSALRPSALPLASGTRDAPTVPSHSSLMQDLLYGVMVCPLHGQAMREPTLRDLLSGWILVRLFGETMLKRVLIICSLTANKGFLVHGIEGWRHEDDWSNMPEKRLPDPRSAWGDMGQRADVPGMDLPPAMQPQLRCLQAHLHRSRPEGPQRRLSRRCLQAPLHRPRPEGPPRRLPLRGLGAPLHRPRPEAPPRRFPLRCL